MRLAVSRVNEAVFGVRAAGVNAVVHPLTDRVVRDDSGRMVVTRRLAGRTVRIHRASGGGILVYEVHAN